MTRKPFRRRLSKKISRDDSTRWAPSPKPGTPHVAVHGASPTAVRARERAVLAREAAVQRLEHALVAEEAVLHGRRISMQPIAEIDRLMAQLREANERLIVASVQAQAASDDAHAEAREARAEIERLLQGLQDANAQLVAASTEARALAEQARQREEDYRRLSSRLLQVQDEERRRLATDLHDSTAQQLAALIMSLDLVKQGDHGLDAPLRRALADSRSLAEQCAQEVRTLSYLLHPPLFDELGLVPTIRWYVKGFTERSGIQVDLDLHEVDRLPGPMEMALYRVVQESLTNIHRHARGSTASVRLASTSRAVTLEVQDRGHGLRDDLKQGTRAGGPETLGVGIQGMRERIRQLRGTFDVAFTDQGTTVRVTVPVDQSLP